MVNNHYETLGVSENVNEVDLKRAFRKLSLETHPDKNPDPQATERFKEINSAYETLSDSEKRKHYDMQRKNGFSSSNGIPDGFSNGFPSGFAFHNGGPGNGIRFHHSGNGHPDIFQQLFTQGGLSGHPNIRVFQHARPNNMQPTKPAPIKKAIDITLEQAFNGHSVLLEIERTVYNDSVEEHEKISLPIRIPEGVDNNEVIVLTERGHMNEQQLQGDVQLIIHIKKHEQFERKGLNLFCKKQITLKESLCGFNFEFFLLNGKRLRVNTQNTITKHGYVKELQAYGMNRNGEKGNLFLAFEIEYPESLTETQKQALESIL